MVREQEDAAQTQFMQYLGADAVITIKTVAGLGTRFVLADAAFLHQRVSAKLVNQVETVLALTKIKHHALPRFSNFLERAAQLVSGVIDSRSKHVAGDVFAVHPH